MAVEIDYDGSFVVTDAKITATMYRGFENILYKRPVQDVIHFVQRI